VTLHDLVFVVGSSLFLDLRQCSWVVDSWGWVHVCYSSAAAAMGLFPRLSVSRSVFVCLDLL
jgi:hypothetical protein